MGSAIELGRNGAPCQNRTDLSDLQDRRIASNAYRAKMERVAGNDPASSVWKTEALPLDDTRFSYCYLVVKEHKTKRKRPESFDPGL